MPSGLPADKGENILTALQSTASTPPAVLLPIRAKRCWKCTIGSIGKSCMPTACAIHSSGEPMHTISCGNQFGRGQLSAEMAYGLS